MTAATFDIRRENLRRLVLDKFEGNRAAYSRAAGVHQNQINLLLTDNAEHRRNLGEALARRMEASLGLVPGYFDFQHNTSQSFQIKAWVVPSGMQSIVRTDDMFSSVNYHDSHLSSMTGTGITSRDNLAICRISTHDMGAEVAFDEHVIVDTGVKAVSSDGVYILSRGADFFLRRVSKQLDGAWLVSAPGIAGDSMRLDSLKGIKAVARLIVVWRYVVL